MIIKKKNLSMTQRTLYVFVLFRIHYFFVSNQKLQKMYGNELIKALNMNNYDKKVLGNINLDQAERLNQHIEQYLRCFIRYFTEKYWTE